MNKLILYKKTQNHFVIMISLSRWSTWFQVSHTVTYCHYNLEGIILDIQRILGHQELSILPQSVNSFIFCIKVTRWLLHSPSSNLKILSYIYIYFVVIFCTWFAMNENLVWWDFFFHFVRSNYTKHLDKVLEEAAAEFYPQIKFMRVSWLL